MIRRKVGILGFLFNNNVSYLVRIITQVKYLLNDEEKVHHRTEGS